MILSAQMARVMLTVLIVCTLGLNLAQCVAACAVEECTPSQQAGDGSQGDTPPCCQHHHQSPDRHAPRDQALAACSHEFLVPGADGASNGQLFPAGNTLASVMDASVAGSPLVILADSHFIPAFSPPDRVLASRSVLRI
jgi:hypothetical protein